MARPPHIVFAGGGTPGHLYPGLAVATHLAERLPEATLTFVGGRGDDCHVIRSAGFGFAQIPSQPAPRTALHAVRFLTDNLAGYWAARWYLREKRVSLVVGLGGASSAATVRAAISRGIPTVLLEQNVVPGRVTRWLARSATAVCLGFDESRAYLPTLAATVTGNPARPAFERLYRQGAAASGSASERRLVIIGGAGGAQTVNEHIPFALASLREELAGWHVVHQSGQGQLQETASRYRAARVDALVVAYIDEVAPVMFASNLVVCRSGGTMLAELALAGVPALLVPYPPVLEFQLANAEVYEAAGAATILNEVESLAPLEQTLANRLRPLLLNDDRRNHMALRMRGLARPDAASQVAGIVCDAVSRTSVRLAA